MTNNPTDETPVAAEPTPVEQISTPLAKPKKNGFGKWVALAAVVLALAAAGFGARWTVYHRPPQDALVRKIVSVYPFPAVKINDTTLSIRDYLVEYDALQLFFASMEGDSAVQMPAEEDLERDLVDTMINKAIVRLLAEQYGVTIDESGVQAMLVDITAESGSEEQFEQEISETFGWTKEEFTSRVIEPVLLATKVSTHVSASADLQKEKKAQIDAAHARLVSGEDFSVVASETNDDRSAIFGGDLGFILLSELPPEWLVELEGMEEGEYSPVIESEEGFSIFSLQERIVAGEDEQVRLSAILVRKVTVEELIETYLEEAEVTRYIGA